MSQYERHAEKSHAIIGNVLDGKEVAEAQRKTALAVLSGDVKEKQAISGKAARVIGLVKHLRVRETREEIALAALAELLPGVVVVRERSGGAIDAGGAREALPATT